MQGGERMWEGEREEKKKKMYGGKIILEVNSYCTQEETQDFGGYFFIGKKHFWSLKSLFSKLQVTLQWGVSTLISFNFLTSSFFSFLSLSCGSKVLSSVTRRRAVRFHSARVHSVHSAVMCLFSFLLSEFWMRAYTFHMQSSRDRPRPDGRLRNKPWWSLLVPLSPLLIPLGQTRERVVNELGSMFRGLVLVGEFLRPVHCGTVRCGRERSEVRRCSWWGG